MSTHHGTLTAYRNHGCRCDDCKRAQREANAANRAARRLEGRITHGTRSGYDAGCRCDDCWFVRALAQYRVASERGRYGQHRPSERFLMMAYAKGVLV